MSDLEFFTPEETGSSEKGPDHTEKQSEKASGRAARSLAWVQRAQKDEKKARRDSDILFMMLVEILKDKTYDPLLDPIVECLSIGVPSNILLGSLSLVHAPTEYAIHTQYSESGKSAATKTLKYQAPKGDPIIFNEKTLDPILRDRINAWITDIYAVITHDPSQILSKKTIQLIGNQDTNQTIIRVFGEIILFFFQNINILIARDTARNYASYILSEVHKKLSRITMDDIFR